MPQKPPASLPSLYPPPPSRSSQPLRFLQSLIIWPVLSPKGSRPAGGEAWGRREPVVAPTGGPRPGRDVWRCRHPDRLPASLLRGRRALRRALGPGPRPPAPVSLWQRVSTAHLPVPHLQAPAACPPTPRHAPAPCPPSPALHPAVNPPPPLHRSPPKKHWPLNTPGASRSPLHFVSHYRRGTRLPAFYCQYLHRSTMLSCRETFSFRKCIYCILSGQVGPPCWPRPSTSTRTPLYFCSVSCRSPPWAGKGPEMGWGLSPQHPCVRHVEHKYSVNAEASISRWRSMCCTAAGGSASLSLEALVSGLQTPGFTPRWPYCLADC